MRLIENDDFIAVTQKMYPFIAEKFGSTPKRVHQDIYHCITLACWRGNKPLIEILFGPKNVDQRITNKEFIATIADIVKTGYLDEIMRKDYAAD